MMDEGPRYAIYFVPAAGSDLYRFGSSILGYDCYTGEAVTHPDDVTGDAASWCSITEEPRRYGFHATLKAPFHLSRDYTELQLADAVRNFADLGQAILGQIENLDRWGYPYLFAHYRFHMTLTGRIPIGLRETTIASLRRCFNRLCGYRTIPIDRAIAARCCWPPERSHPRSRPALSTISENRVRCHSSGPVSLILSSAMSGGQSSEFAAC
jgi:Protein of unknown function (DUF1045)